MARELDAGAQEIVLTGVDITSYEGGLGPLCQTLLAELPRLKRLRLSSLDSIEIDEALMELVAGEPRLLPHFHLSLQAGDDLILKRMKRRHSRAQAVATVERLKAARGDVTIGADLIAGFPTESEEAALNTLRAARRLRHRRRAHLPLLAPARHAGGADAAAGARDGQGARRTAARGGGRHGGQRWLDGLVGTRQTVLIENSEKGHSDGFAPVRIAGIEARRPWHGQHHWPRRRYT